MDVEALVRRSAEIQPLWEALRLRDRARYLDRAAQAVIDEFDELTRVLGEGAGRPPGEVATLELLPATDGLSWLAEIGSRALRERRVRVPLGTNPLTRARVAYEPLGIVAIVGASDAPFAQPLWQVGAALLAGNGVVFKPSPRATEAGLRIGRLFARAGLPEGLLAIAPGDDDVGRALVAAPGLRKVAFTGTREAADQVARGCAQAGVTFVLEVDGVGSALVLSDAVIQRAARGAVAAAFAANGRTRGALRRAFVAADIHAAWLAETVGHARRLPPTGDPGRAAELVEEAVAAGARLCCGGPQAGGAFAPAVLDGVTAEMRAGRESADGPLLCVTRVEGTDEAIAASRALPPGPGTSIWTQDKYEGARIARALRPRATWLNDHQVGPALPAVPWGGGVGGVEGVRAFASAQGVVLERASGRAVWWGPHDETTAAAARAVARLRSVRDSDRERAWREGAVPIARVVVRALRRR